MWGSVLQADMWQKLKKFGKSKGLQQEVAEDFASEAFICLFRGRKASFDQLLVDFKRKEYGDSRSKHFRFREPTEFTEFERIGGINKPCAGTEPDSDEAGRNSLYDGFFLTGSTGRVWDLVTVCGYKETEVADMLGVTESRISQIMTKAKKEFEGHVLLKDLQNKLEDDHEYLELKVEWITI